MGFEGLHHTAETKQLLSVAKQGTHNPFYGQHHTDETRQRISTTLRGVPHSPEHREKIRLARIGQRNTREAKERMSRAKLEKHLTPEHRAKLSLANKGRVVTAETRAKMKATREMLIAAGGMVGVYNARLLDRPGHHYHEDIHRGRGLKRKAKVTWLNSGKTHWKDDPETVFATFLPSTKGEQRQNCPHGHKLVATEGRYRRGHDITTKYRCLECGQVFTSHHFGRNGDWPEGLWWQNPFECVTWVQV